MKRLKTVLKWLGIGVVLLGIVAGIVYAIYLRPFMQKMKETNTIAYDKALTIVLGGGGNSGILVSDSLVLVIDTKMDEAAANFYQQVKQIAGNKPIFVVNTHIHPDHTKGNTFYKGQTILAGGNYAKDFWIQEAGAETLPSQWLKDNLNLKMGDEMVTIFNLAKNVHTESDVMVYLHNRKLLFAGDVILNKQAPVLMGNANIDGYLETFATLPNRFEIKTIVPGHGSIGGIEVMNVFKQYFEDMKLAATDNSQKQTLIDKYKDWGQLPIFMSPEATIRYVEKMKGK